MFKQISKFSDYLVTDRGEVISLILTHNLWGRKPRYKTLKLTTQRNGYVACSIVNNNGKVFTRKVHRLVAEAFISNPDNLPCVNHINGIKTDNRVENLEWCSHSHNTRHAYNIGLCVGRSGTNNNQAKLTIQDVKTIRQLKGIVTQSTLATRFGVTQSNIGCVQRGVSWRTTNA